MVAATYSNCLEVERANQQPSYVYFVLYNSKIDSTVSFARF